MSKTGARTCLMPKKNLCHREVVINPIHTFFAVSQHKQHMKKAPASAPGHVKVVIAIVLSNYAPHGLTNAYF